MPDRSKNELTAPLLIKTNLPCPIKVTDEVSIDKIKEEAEKRGVKVIGSEVIGLVPMNALIDVAEHYLKIENFKKDQILEKRLKE